MQGRLRPEGVPSGGLRGAAGEEGEDEERRLTMRYTREVT